jgi:hypothetical protein
LHSTEQAPGRTELRIAVHAEAVIVHQSEARTARLQDLSRRGAALWAAAPPPAGATVTLELGPMTIAGRVAWTEGRRFGLRFDRRLRATEVFLISRQSRLAPAA